MKVLYLFFLIIFSCNNYAKIKIPIILIEINSDHIEKNFDT